MFKFPFTNFHELNLDWVLGVVKKFSELINPMQEAVDNVQQALDDATQASHTAQQALENAGTALTTANEAKEIAEGAAQGVIPNLGVTTAKLADHAVTGIKIANGAVSTEQLYNGAVTLNKLAAEAKTLQNVVIVNFANVSSTNLSFTVSGITANHNLIPNCVFFSNPAIVVSDVTFTTGANSVVISGDFDGQTDITACFAVFQNRVNI